jgi:subtilisin family serine protease
MTAPRSTDPRLAAAPDAPWAEGEAPAAPVAPASPPLGVMVQFAPGVAPDLVAAVLEAAGATPLATLRAATAEDGPLLLVAAETPPEDLAEYLAVQPGVAFAEPDQAISIEAVSNDPRYLDGSLWGLQGDGTGGNAFGSGAAEAWAAGRLGTMKTVVGVVDTGMDYRHIDLYRNVFLNQGEIPAALKAVLLDTDKDGLITFRDLNDARNAPYVSDLNRNGRVDAADLLTDSRWENGRDEDGNGYKDDLVGWDFVNNDNDPFDDNGHGTHVSGTIGATGGDGVGIAGIDWNVQIVALKAMGASGSGSLSAAVQAIDYFTNLAAKAGSGLNFVGTNNSWGGPGTSQALADAVGRAAKQDLLFIAAAGNGGSDGIGDNNDSIANWPSNLNTGTAAGYDAVVSVAALTAAGARAGFSNFGKVSVDLAAPGAGILSTLPGDAYGTMSGTSMATPHVTGAAALYASANPTASAAEIKAAILGSVTATTGLAGVVANGGRLDIGMLMGMELPPPRALAGVTITRVVDDAGTIKGNITAGGLTDDRTPTFYGSLGEKLGTGDVVAIYRDGTRAGEATVSGQSWSYAEKLQLAAGAHSYAARVEAKTGAAGTAASFDFTVDLGPNRFTGTAGNDTLTGTSGADRLGGVPDGATMLGRGTIDRLTGGAGNDIFVLGDQRGVFYDDGVAGSAGRGDYAQIMDFRSGDKIQLSSAAGGYVLTQTSIGGLSGLGIFADLNRNGVFDATDELVGHVVGVTSLRSTDFLFA